MVLFTILIGAYGLKGPELLKMYMKVMDSGVAPSVAVILLPVMLMSPMELGYPCAVLPDSAFMKMDPSVASIVLSAMIYPFAAFWVLTTGKSLKITFPSASSHHPHLMKVLLAITHPWVEAPPK